MAPLSGKTIIYDDNCPMCAAYTGAFVKFGLLEQDGRLGFEDLSQDMSCQLDLNRARHEIPLLDRESGEVTYGKEALFMILGTRWPILKPLFRFAPFRMMIHLLYQLITYNRRVIVGSKGPSTGFDCAPDFHLGWRWIYITLALSWAFYLISQFTTSNILFENSAISPYTLASFYIASFVAILAITRNFTISAIGQLSTIALMGALSILPSIWFAFPIAVVWGNVGIGMFMMGREVKRRFL
jgi:predicted DCC family thiol-disulfide oxidoreductase YuxK